MAVAAAVVEAAGAGAGVEAGVGEVVERTGVEEEEVAAGARSSERWTGSALRGGQNADSGSSEGGPGRSRHGGREPGKRSTGPQ